MPVLVAHLVVVEVLGVVGQQVFCQQPDRIGGLELAVVLAAFELFAVDVSPVVDDSSG